MNKKEKNDLIKQFGVVSGYSNNTESYVGQTKFFFEKLDDEYYLIPLAISNIIQSYAMCTNKSVEEVMQLLEKIIKDNGTHITDEGVTDFTS